MKLDVFSLTNAYRSGRLNPAEVIAEVYRRIRARGERPVWIHVIPEAEALALAEALGPYREDLPLYGIPFAIKDNIDLAGVPTTAGCPEFACIPSRSATVAEKLIAAGAIPIGKTNLDQFATGLVGTRSPYGACSSVIDERYISGGSSSGSSVAVARGLVSFSLGTDTAGPVVCLRFQRDSRVQTHARRSQRFGGGSGWSYARLRFGFCGDLCGGRGHFSGCPGFRCRRFVFARGRAGCVLGSGQVPVWRAAFGSAGVLWRRFGAPFV